MAGKNWTDSETNELRRRISQGDSPKEIADSLPGRTIASIENQIKRLGLSINAARESKNEVDVSRSTGESFRVNGDDAILTKPSSFRITSLTELVAFCQIDEVEWDIVSWECKAYEGYIKNNSDEIESKTHYSVSAKMKRNKTAVRARDVIIGLIAEMDAHSPKYKPISYSLDHEPMLALVVIADLHLGKLGWADEVGENCDSKIAERAFRQAVTELLAKVKREKPEKIAFVFGNDFFNSDNMTGTTTKGTPQDNDGRYAKMFSLGKRMLVWAIDQALLIAPVDVIIVPGNHDRVSMFTLGDSIQSWYRNCPNVWIDNQPTDIKYYSYGHGLLGFFHGDKGKASDLPLRMATEQRQRWGQTLWADWHLGHRHTERSTEYMGVRVCFHSSLSGIDAYHYGEGYIGNRRAAKAIFYHADCGENGTATHVVRPESVGAVS